MIYTTTIGLSALLLFLVQPFISKMLLPYFGGGASIWITSMVFFQFGLLIGYGATHILIKRFGIRKHLGLMVALLVVSLAFLPISVNGLQSGSLPPALLLVLTLAMSVGIPYLVLASTSPTLQYCVATDGRYTQANPYIQYGVSNLGSLAGLLLFPFVLEPRFGTSLVAQLWTGGYAAYALLIIVTAGIYLKNHHEVSAPVEESSPGTENSGLHWRWLFLAAVPSATLVVTTHYLTMDIANLPLLWVAPLCLYLLTFILCFLFPGVSKPRIIRTVAGLAGVALLIGSKWVPQLEFQIVLSLVALFLICLIIHGDLEQAKPHKLNLTRYYVHVAAGGCLGSILAALVAPVIFDSLFEFHVVTLIIVYYLITSGMEISTSSRWALRFAVLLSLCASYVTNETTLGGETVERSRSFYSTYAVRESDGLRRLVVGTHVHGAQYMDPQKHRSPLAYYHEGTVIPWVFEIVEPRKVGLVGLGIGSLVAYGTADMEMDLYEIDPEVVRLAKESFTNLANSESSLNAFVGDARIRWNEQQADTYDLIILDAFSSGTIPAHLMTLEAIDELLHIVKDDGLIVYHISNKHVDLSPVLFGIAEELGVEALHHLADSDLDSFKFPTDYVLISRNRGLLEEFTSRLKGWQPTSPITRVWTDDFSNIWSVLK